MQLASVVKQELEEHITLVEKDIINKANVLKRFIVDRQELITASILAKHDSLHSTMPGSRSFFVNINTDLATLKDQFANQVIRDLELKLIEVKKYLSQLKSELECFNAMETELHNQISTYPDPMINHLNTKIVPQINKITEHLASIKQESANILITKGDIQALLKAAMDFQELPYEELSFFLNYLENYESQVFAANNFCVAKWKDMEEILAEQENQLKNLEKRATLLLKNKTSHKENDEQTNKVKLALSSLLKDSQEEVKYLLTIKNELEKIKEDIGGALTTFSTQAETFASENPQAFVHLYSICACSSIYKNKEVSKDYIEKIDSLLDQYKEINQKINNITNGLNLAPVKRAEPFEKNADDDDAEMATKTFKKS